MEIKKCSRCGTFFTSEAQVCQNCLPKDKQEMIKLQGYIDENSSELTKQKISIDTGISAKNLDRYLQLDEFKDVYIGDINADNTDLAGNLSTNL